ncbi:MAG TPA: DUF1549 and DUF1553 domain-containing protein [Gemmataceae bacterium]|nr:DUF1549 and DUF1553 domain-containing protein [Gemmataceae bacterium]
MGRIRLSVGLVCLALATSVARAAPPPKASPPPDDVATLAARIDRLIETGYVENSVEPAPLADDAEFIRRVYLDLAGHIPRVSEVHKFLDDKATNKRLALVEELLKGPHYVNHFTNVWRALLLPQNNNQQVQFLAGQIEGWVRPRLRDNKPYDQMVRELLTAPVVFNRGGMPQRNGTDFGAIAFYQANESKPENVAAATSRLFLGIKLECAQCHNHPFARWSRKQFWEYAAFFSGIRPQQAQAGVFSQVLDDPTKREIKIPNSDKTVTAHFLDGKEPKWKDGASTRATLAEWMTAGDNPFFAKAIANRLWGHFFGLGIIDPVDDFGEANPPSHPQLLDELGQAMVKHKFDMRFMIRAITASRTYQRTSRMTDSSQEDPRLFARMPLKGLTAEQIFDSLALATGYRDPQANSAGGFNRFNGARAEFLLKFANNSDKRTEYQTSILQALSLMNGTFIANATSLDRSETLAGLLDAPFMNNRQRLDALHLAALGRPMHAREADRLLSYVERGGPSGDKRRALADVFWTLLNSSEFIFNH